MANYVPISRIDMRPCDGSIGGRGRLEVVRTYMIWLYFMRIDSSVQVNL